MAALSAISALVLSFVALDDAPPAHAAACVASGTPLATNGTSGSPTLISTAAELVQLSDDSNGATALTGYYKLDADIDLAGCEWTPIGNHSVSSRWFQGTLDGNGHTISNLSITSGSNQLGLVGYTYQGTIKNLGVVDASISVGASTFDVGIVVGRARGTVSNVFSSGSVSGDRRVGGLVGSMESLGAISNSYSTATVTGTGDDIGGLLGLVQGTAGASSLSNSYSVGLVTSPSGSRGGLVGQDDTGSGPFTVSNSFYDTTTSGQSDTGYGDPKTTSEMTALSTFSNASWDISDGWEAFDAASNKIWGICSGVNSGYPYLLWEHSEDPCVAVGDSSSSAASPPGIFLTVTGRVGYLFESSGVVYGAYAVAPNSAYQLSVQSISNPTMVNRVLASGRVNSGGHLEAKTALPFMAAGNYKITITGTSANGDLLKLTNHVNVNERGRYTSISPERLQPHLP